MTLATTSPSLMCRPSFSFPSSDMSATFKPSYVFLGITTKRDVVVVSVVLSVITGLSIMLLTVCVRRVKQVGEWMEANINNYHAVGMSRRQHVKNYKKIVKNFKFGWICLQSLREIHSSKQPCAIFGQKWEK